MNIKRHQAQITGELMSLLLTADPSSESISKYITDGNILVGEVEGQTVGVAVVSLQDNVAELRNIAVAEGYQGRGLAKQMISDVKKLAKRLGATTVLVGTGNSSLSQLALYQKCGFRMHHIDVGYFAEYPSPIFENGIRCLDRVLLCADL